MTQPRRPRGLATSRKALFSIGLACLLGALATAAIAQSQTKRPTLHEDVAPPPNVASAVGKTLLGPQPAEGQNPAAFANGERILPQPRRDLPKGPSEPIHGRGGFAADRDTEARPDLQTGSDDTLQYVTVYNPSVLPFKRMSSMDQVRDDYTLHVTDEALRDLTVGGDRDPARDLFWGSLVVEFAPGRDVPIPSVSPDMRILSYEIEPATTVTFSKDGADNYYVRSDESGVSGTYRLVFLVDADAGYFAPKVPRRYRVGDVARRAPKGLLQTLPARAQQAAERALARLQIGRYTSLDTALDKLVYYFREFEAKSQPASSGDIYWDLFTSQAGVCRHRSFAFVVTAIALGLPARYVTNEAHAFVEVWAPEAGWMRIDLGGAALRMEVSNAEDKSIYQPRDDDKFAQPPNYQNNYTQLEGEIGGLSSEQLAEARSLATPSDIIVDVAGPADEDPDATGTGPGRIGPGRSLPELDKSVLENKTPTRLVVSEVDRVGYRGETLRVRGTLTRKRGGDGVGDQRVDIYLAPAGNDGDDAILVGHIKSDDNGTFFAEVELPADMGVGEYEVFAATPGTAKLAPALSD